MSDRTHPRKTNDSLIARLRMDHGLTQAQLAELVGCHPRHISRWENRSQRPGSRYLARLAAALECSVDDILSDQA